MSPESPRVIVVGAGIVGASIAWHLAAQHGAAVTVVASAGGVGGTATPNSFAWINANRGNARNYYELRRRSMARWRELTAVNGGVLGLSDLVRWTGTIQWNQPPDELAQFLAEHRSWGYRVERIDNDALAQKEPAVSENTALPSWGWAVQATDEGAIEPALAAQQLLEQATTAYGTRVLVDTTVKSLAVSGATSRVTGIVIEDGTQLDADHVVLAAGLGSVPLCAVAGIVLPVFGRPGLLAHSKPVAKRLLNGIVLSVGPHLRQTVVGRLVVGADFAGGGGGNFTSPDEQREAAFKLIDEAKKLFRPDDAALLELDYFTVGERPQPRDGLPIIDANVRPGLAVAVMHSGVTLAAIVGELLAKEIVTSEADEALKAFSIKRFGDGIATEI